MSTAQRQKKIYRFDVHVGFEGNYGSVGYGKMCLLVWSCVEERGWSGLRKGKDFEVEGERKNDRPLRKWKKQAEEESMKVDLRRNGAHRRSWWSVCMNRIAAG